MSSQCHAIHGDLMHHWFSLLCPCTSCKPRS